MGPGAAPGKERAGSGERREDLTFLRAPAALCGGHRQLRKPGFPGFEGRAWWVGAVTLTSHRGAIHTLTCFLLPALPAI